MQNQSVRAIADRLRVSVRRAETATAQIRRYWSPADLSVGVACLRDLRQHQRIAPTTQNRKVLLARAKTAQADLVRVLAELRAIVRKRSDAPLIDAPAPTLMLPDAAPVAEPAEPVRLRYDGPECVRDDTPMPRISEYRLYKVLRQRDGSWGDYKRTLREAQARYAKTPKGKAARKRAQARYRAKLKAQQQEQMS